MANKHADEYRREVVDYVPDFEGTKSIKECAGELGLNEKTLGHWVSKFRKDGRTGSGTSDQEKELARANKRIRELEMENEFLKNCGLLRQEPSVEDRRLLMAAEKGGCPVKMIAELPEAGRQDFYQWLSRNPYLGRDPWARLRDAILATG